MRTLICVLLLGSLSPAGLAAQPVAAPAPLSEAAPARVNARQLLALVRDNLAQTARAAAVSHIDRGNPRYNPFGSTCDQMAASVERIGSALRDKSPALFPELRNGTRALEAMSTVWRWMGKDEPAVSTALQSVVVSYRLLRGQYGLEALRAREPGDLSGAERRQLQAWQRIQRRLAARLEVLQAEAVRQRDRRMQEELRRIQERASRIAFAPVTLDSYLEAAEANDEVQGEWDGASYYVDPENGPIWEDTYEVVEELSIEQDDSPMVVMASNLTTGESWSFLDDETDLPVEILPLDSTAADVATPAPIPAEPVEDDEIWAVQGLSAAPVPPAGPEAVETVEIIETPEAGEAVETAMPEAAKVDEGEKAWPEHSPEEGALTVEDIEDAKGLEGAKELADGKAPAAPADAKAAETKPAPEKKSGPAAKTSAKPAPGPKAKVKVKAKPASKPAKKSPPSRPRRSH